MSKQKVLLSLLLSVGLVFGAAAVVADAEYDIVLRNARIYNGSLDEPFQGDIGIKDGKIVEVGKIRDPKADKVIAAKGLYAAPGFIDLHTHVDRGMTYKELRACLNYLKQGVTTVVVGQCGRSAWPVFEKIEDQVDRWRKDGIGVNAALLVGHGQVRELVMGVEDREPTAEELDRMKVLVREGMEGGAYGFSTGLGYIPGRYGKTNEVIALVREIVPYGGIYHSHIRNEGDTLIESIREAIEIAEKTGAPTNISHLKASRKPNWGKTKEACRLIEEARAKGMNVTADQYPYPISSGNPYRNLIPRTTWLGREDTRELRVEMTQALDSLRDETLLKLYQLQTPFMPVSEHHREYLDALSRQELVRVVTESLGRGMGRGAENLRERNAFLRRMDQSDEAQKIRKEIEDSISEWVGAENIIVDISVETELIGKSLKQVAEMKGKTIADAAIHLELQGAKVTPLQMALEDVEYIMKKDYVSLGSDGTAPFFGLGLVHPRSYGAFPEKIRKYAMDRKVISLPHAIRSCTSLPAEVMGWKDRGSIKKGYRADVVVFDPKTYGPRGNFTNAHRYAEGVEYLLVNGKLVIDDGEFNGNLSGQVLLLKEPKYTSLN